MGRRKDNLRTPKPHEGSKSQDTKPVEVESPKPLSPRLPNVFETCTPLAAATGTAIAIILRYDLYSFLPPALAVLFIFFLTFPIWWSFGRTPIHPRFSKVTIRRLVSLVFCVAVLGSSYWEYWLARHRPTEATHALLPAGDLYFQDECADRLPAGALVIYLGNSTAYIPVDSKEYKSASPLIILSSSNVPFLTIERAGDGFYVTAQIMSKDRQFAATVQRNSFINTVARTWYQTRLDDSTIAVYDERDEEILYVRYMNSSAIKIRGVFGAPGKHALLITDSEMSVPALNQHLSKLCIGSISDGYRF